MKKNVLLVALIAVVVSTSFAQDQCAMNYSLYKEFLNVESYENALPNYRLVLAECPKFSKTIYNDGIKIYKGMIAKTSDQKLINAYVDTLKLIYTQRIENYGEEAYVLGRYASDLLKYKKDATIYHEAFEVLSKAMSISIADPELSSVSLFVQVASVEYQKGEIDANQLFNSVVPVYRKVVENVLSQSKDEKYCQTAEKIFASVEKSFVNLKNYQSTFTELFDSMTVPETELEAKALSQTIAAFGCEKSALYAKVSEKLYQNNPTAETAYAIARFYRKNKDWDKASTYYEEALSKESDNIKKSTYLFEYATVEHYRNHFGAAISKAKKSVALNPNAGTSYMLIAAIYGANANLLSSDAFVRSEFYWVAADYLILAKKADPSLANEVNSKLAQYAALFPNQEEAFMHSINEGDIVKLKGYDLETTTARF